MMKTRTNNNGTTTFKESSYEERHYSSNGGGYTTNRSVNMSGRAAAEYLDTLPHSHHLSSTRTRSIGRRSGGVAGNEFDPTVLQRAVRVGSPVSVDSDPGEDDRIITKRYVREVEVPYVRKVKVPVTVDRIVSTVETKRVPTKRIVEVPGWQEVDEVYTETQEVPAVREKEVWVKKIVQEPYMKQVEVKKTRKKKVPATDFKEVTEYVDVEVPVDRIAPGEGYRVDEVEDTKLVEVEEYETFKLQPYRTGEREVTKTREIGAIKKRSGGHGHLTRTVGTRIYRIDEVASLSSDSDIDETVTLSYSNRGISNRNIHTSRGSRFATMYEGSGRVSRGGDFTARAIHTSHSARTRDVLSESHIVHTMASLIGITIKNHERGGCRVIKVHHAKPAFHAGVKEGDVIVDIDNHPTLNLDDFRRAFTKTGALIHLTVKRSGNLITMKVRRPLN